MKNLSHITTHLVVLVVVGATLFETATAPPFKVG